MTENSPSFRNGLLCVLIFSACFCIAWPVAEMGFVDDWSYIKSAQVFAQTGHLVYNGWATAMLGWQVAWGALFIHFFGFSFTIVKLSTLPVAMATILLFHGIQVRFGISASNAVIGTLTLCLSPLFLPLAASYMTDLPGLFVIMLCLYCCQRAVQTHGSVAAIAWLSLAAASNIVGGTCRQIAWLGVLVMVPSAGWLMRQRRGVLPAAALLWVGGVAFVLGCMHWFARQPYSIPEAIFPSYKGPIFGLLCIVDLSLLVLVLLLAILPVLIAWLPLVRKIDNGTIVTIMWIPLTFACAQWLSKRSLPWIFNIILSMFVTTRIADVTPPDYADFIFPLPVCILVSLLVTVSSLVFLAAVWKRLRARKFKSLSTAWREIFWLVVPFTVSYFVLLFPRASQGAVIDRYSLSLMPMAIICLIWAHQQWIASSLPRGSVLTLVLFAILAIAGTHDWFAWQRARLKAIEAIRAQGVPRTEIQGGFEYDGWTQIEGGGHINDYRIEVPPGSYKSDHEIPPVANECRLVFAPFTPGVHPKYTVAFGPKSCFVPSGYPPVRYFAWVPPFRRAIYIQLIPSAIQTQHNPLPKP